ncbi:MAG: hypothetical protein ACXVXP_10320 [Mycobacteriaceae bacterium]
MKSALLGLAVGLTLVGCSNRAPSPDAASTDARATATLGTLNAPPGFEDCPDSPQLRAAGGFCWNGRGSAPVLASHVVNALKGLPGGHITSATCGTLLGRTYCQISGQLQGQRFAATVHPLPPYGSHRIQVNAGLNTQADIAEAPVDHFETPVPIPTG